MNRPWASVTLGAIGKARASKHRRAVTSRSRQRHITVQVMSRQTRALPVVRPSLMLADCPECRAIGSVIFGTCEVCFAEFDEDPYETIGHGGDETMRPSSR